MGSHEGTNGFDATPLVMAAKTPYQWGKSTMCGCGHKANDHWNNSYIFYECSKKGCGCQKLYSGKA